MQIHLLNFNLNLISKYRSELMGIATIGILMCHALAYDVDLPFQLNGVLGLDQGGVSIFFFLSGLGLYYSTRSLSGGLKDVGKWYKRRFVRLLVPYLIIYGAFLFLKLSEGQNLNVGEYLYYLSTIAFWCGDGGCWFVCVLVPLYLLTPFWNVLLEKSKYPIIPTIIVMAAMLVANSPFAAYFEQASFFFAGFWIARYVKSEVTIPTKWTLLIGVAFSLLLASYYLFGFGSLLSIMLLPAVWLFCIILDKCRNTFVNPMLRFFGGISLESYLFNTTLITWINHFNLLPGSLYDYRYVFIVVFGILLSWGVNRLCRPIVTS